MRTHVMPVDGETVVVSATVPVNPWRPLRVMVDVPEEPARTATLVGDAFTVKS